MDVVKFLKERKRMCESHDRCAGCKLFGKCDIAEIELDKMEDVVRNVEEWSKEHPSRTNLQVIVDDLVEKNFGEDFKGFNTEGDDTLLLHFRDADFLFKEYEGRRIEQTEDKLSFKEVRDLFDKMCSDIDTLRSCDFFNKTNLGCNGCKKWCFDHPEEAQEIVLDWKKEQERKR